MNTIKKIAEEFDEALEQKNIQKALEIFSEDCVIEILGVTLNGKKGAKKWLDWLYSKAPALEFEPVVIISEGNIFYEEFLVHAVLPNGKKVSSHQAETLIFENGKLKTLRVFFNPLDFSDLVAKGPISKGIINIIQKKAIEGLID